MADVTSTAKLIVEVSGEDKVKRLAASLKALAGAGGTKKIGVGGGQAGLASQMAASHLAVKRSLSPLIASQAVTARMMAPIVAQQAIMAKAMAPIAVAQTSMAKTVAPLVAGQAAAAKLAKATDLAAGMAVAEKARAAVLARKKEVYPEQAPGPSGMTSGVLASIRRRGGTGTDEDIRARFAHPAALRAAPAAGAGLAEAGAGMGLLGLAGRVALGVGAVGAIGGATVALTGLMVVIAGLSAAAWAANKGLDAAGKTAEGIWKNLGRAKAQGKTVDQIQDRDALRDALFGDKAEGFENRLPKLLTDQKRKRGIAGDKGIFGTLGLDRKTMADMEKKGEADATGVLTRISDKRAEIEQKLEAAKAPKQKAALEQKLRSFDKSMNLFVGKPLADAVRGLPKGAARQFADDLKRVNDAFDAVVPSTTPKQLEQQAAAYQRAQFRSQQIGVKRDDAIGKIALPAATRFQEAINDINAKLSPAFAQITGNLGRLALDAGTAILKALPTDKIAAAAGVVGKYLADLKLEQIPDEIGKAWEGVKTAMQGGLDSAIANQAALWGGLGESITSGLTSAVEAVKGTAPGLFSGLGGIISEAISAAIAAAKSALGLGPEKPADIVPRGRDELQDQPSPPLAPTTPRFEELQDLPAKASEAGSAFSTAATEGIPAAGTGGGNAFSTAAASGLSTAGSQAGGAFNSAVNAQSIGAAIGAAAAAAISQAKVTVNIPGAVGGGKPSNGGDGPVKGAASE